MKIIAVTQVIRSRKNISVVASKVDHVFEIDSCAFNELDVIADKGCEVIIDSVEGEEQAVLSAKLLTPVSDSFCNDSFVVVNKGDNLFICLRQLNRMLAQDTNIKLNEGIQDKLKQFFKL